MVWHMNYSCDMQRQPYEGKPKSEHVVDTSKVSDASGPGKTASKCQECGTTPEHPRDLHFLSANKQHSLRLQNRKAGLNSSVSRGI